MKHPNEEQIKDIISKILNSPEFHDSKRYQALLQYLISKTSSVDTLKETEIAHELFGKDSNFDPGSDPLIRSYISNLRKKLEHYYLTTSDDIDFKVEIPKGQYLIRYTKVDKTESKRSNQTKANYTYLGIILVLIVIILWREIPGPGPVVPNSSTPYTGNKVWKEFVMPSSKPTIVVLGDYEVLSEKGRTSHRSFLRVPGINSDKDFADSIKANPAKYKELEISKVTFLSTGASLGVTSLIDILSRNKKLSFKLSRDITWDDIEKNNIIFVGNLKTLYKLDTLVSRMNISYELAPNSLTVHNKDNSEVKHFSLDWTGGAYEKNYGLILKQRLSKDNYVLILSGFSTVGVLDAVKSSLDPEIFNSVKKFSGVEVPDSVSQFKLITESEGLGYNVFKSQIRYFENF